MTWREKIIARLVLIVALMMAEDATTRNELRALLADVKQGGELVLGFGTERPLEVVTKDGEG